MKKNAVELSQQRITSKTQLNVQFSQEINRNLHREPHEPVSYFRLYEFASVCELLVLLVAIILATINASFVPLGTIVYGEFTALLVERTVMSNTTQPTIVIHLFGGGKAVTNGTREQYRKALIQDSMAFGIGGAVFAVIQFIVAATSVNIFNYVALRQVERIKVKFLRSVLSQDATWYDLNTTINFATKVSDDLEKLREGIGEKVPILVFLVMSFVISVVVAFLYGWELTLIILSCTPVIIASTYIVSKIQSSITTKELETYSVAGMLAEEVLSSIRTVIAFGGEQKELHRFSKELHPAKSLGIRKGIFAGIGSGVMWLIIYGTYALSFWYGISLILDSRREEKPLYTPATLMIIFFCVLQGAQNVGLSSPHIEAMAQARASGRSILHVINRHPDIDSLSTDGGLKPAFKGDMRLVNIKFKYPARHDIPVLDGLNLEIKCGETVALVGKTGCGKSTVLQLIQRSYDPDKGHVYASGYDLKTINVKHLRSQMAVVGQEPVLFAGTIKENIRMGNPLCTDAEIESACREAYCHDFIINLPDGYDTIIGERGSSLSGGQKQRIAIARALVRHPKLLILDEATSALDSQSEAQVQRALDAVAQSRTTVMVCHRLSTVLNADRIVFIKKGKVVEQGTHEELLALKGFYYQLVLENDPSIANSGQADFKVNRQKKIIESLDLMKIDENKRKKSEDGSKNELKGKESSIEGEERFVTPSSWQILKLCKPEARLMVIGLIAALLMGSTFPMFAVLFGEVYGLLESPDENYIRGESNIISLLFVCVGLIAGISVFTQIFIFNLCGVRLTSRLRVAAFDAILKQEIGWFDKPTNGVGALCSRLAGDAAGIQGATGTRIGALMQASATIIIGVILSLFYSWKMTLVSLICVPLIIGAVILEGKLESSGHERVRLANNQATTIATEAISNIRTVSAFCGEEHFLERYQKASEYAKASQRKNIRWRGPVFGFGQTAPVAGYGLSLWYGGILVANREVPYKNVIKVSEALIFGSMMMGQALAFAPNIGGALQSAGRIMALLQRKPKVLSTETPSVAENYVAEGKINYKNVHFRYPTRRYACVLKGFTLEVPSGKRIALVGPSGCGKSTLMQLLQRFYDPDAGSVLLDGYNIVKDMRLTTLRRNLGIVSQEPVLFNRSIKENIAYGDNTRSVPLEDIISAAKAANVHTFITTLPRGYETRIGARASQISGGQKQRIAIARALVRNPRVLLLDEATSALDAHSEKLVQEALDQASNGRTCLIIAHHLATVMNADAICVIDKGEIQELGTHSELMALRGIYAKLYEIQCG